jgi:hypothetical protein
MTEEDDPFDVFGDDDGDDDDDGKTGSQTQSIEENEGSRIARSLVDQTNEKLRQVSTDASPIAATTTTGIETEVASAMAAAEEKKNSEIMSHFKELKLHSWPSPLYKGPMMLVAKLPFGGGRGYIAVKRLDPGTLVLVEEPMMEWPSEQLGAQLDLISVRCLLEHPNAVKLVHDMEEFYPTKENVDCVGDNDDQIEDDSSFKEQVSDMIQSFRSQFPQHDVHQLVQLAQDRGVTCRDTTHISSTDVLRMFLALRYNGLESGVYRHVAMFNHNCHPNCAKFLPASNQRYSEVRTVRAVAAGESLTISYVPRVMSHASRRNYLWEQHRFDIGAALKGDRLKIELIRKSLPPSFIHRWDPTTSVTHHIETATEELEKMYTESSGDTDGGTAPPEVWEIVKALEVSSLELYNEAVTQLMNERHIILLPCLSLHLEACQLVQRAPGLSTAVQLNILSRMISTTRKLIALQEAVLGPDHFDLARTNLDLADAIAELQSRSRKHLPIDPSQTSVQDWSAVEQKSRREHLRIKALYPHDADEMVVEQKKKFLRVAK